MQKTDVLKYVAKTGGIKLESEPDTWYNPTKENLESIKSQIEKIKQYIGRSVTLDLEDKNIFSAISINQENGLIECEEETIKRPEPILDRKYIVNISGKEFVTMAGLLDVAHKKGLKSIRSEMVESNQENKEYIFKTEVVLKNGSSFVSYGDANPNNVGNMIKPHIIRMAETRSIARSLRWATNIGMCSLEELGNKEEENGNQTFNQDRKPDEE